jgi:hypothetical protein
MRSAHAVGTFAWQGVCSRPLESVLMVLTFTVVFGASLTAVSLIRSGRAEFTRSMELLGKDLIHVHKSLKLQGLLGGMRNRLTVSDARIAAAAAHGSAAPARITDVVLGAGDREVSSVLVGTEASWPAVNGSTFKTGEFFAAGETDACALDAWVARELFDAANPVGKTVSATWADGKKTFVVRGVIADPSSIRERLQGFDVLSAARPTILRLLEARNLFVPIVSMGPGDDATFLLVKHGSDLTPPEAVARIRKAFGERAEGLTVWARGPWIDMIMEAANVAYIFSNAVWGIFLCLAGAMIMTISLLSLSSRMLEFGIRRSQGATRLGICGQILLEGFLLGALGAILGTAASPFVGDWLCRKLPWQIVFRLGDVAFVAGAGVLVIVLSFVVPALRAARLEPVDVLRER